MYIRAFHHPNHHLTYRTIWLLTRAGICSVVERSARKLCGTYMPMHIAYLIACIIFHAGAWVRACMRPCCAFEADNNFQICGGDVDNSVLWLRLVLQRWKYPTVRNFTPRYGIYYPGMELHVREWNLISRYVLEADLWGIAPKSDKILPRRTTRAWEFSRLIGRFKHRKLFLFCFENFSFLFFTRWKPKSIITAPARTSGLGWSSKQNELVTYMQLTTLGVWKLTALTTWHLCMIDLMKLDFGRKLSRYIFILNFWNNTPQNNLHMYIKISEYYELGY
jgi:hypothetical protein